MVDPTSSLGHLGATGYEGLGEKGGAVDIGGDRTISFDPPPTVASLKEGQGLSFLFVLKEEGNDDGTKLSINIGKGTPLFDRIKELSEGEIAKYEGKPENERTLAIKALLVQFIATMLPTDAVAKGTFEKATAQFDDEGECTTVLVGEKGKKEEPIKGTVARLKVEDKSTHFDKAVAKQEDKERLEKTKEKDRRTISQHLTHLGTPAKVTKMYAKINEYISQEGKGGEEEIHSVKDQKIVREKHEVVKKDIEWYKKAAKQGNADAQNHLGVCYENGTGVDINLKTATEWYKKAADQGDTDAMNRLARLYEKGGKGVQKDLVEAEKYDKSAKLKNLMSLSSRKKIMDKFGVDPSKKKAHVKTTKKKETPIFFQNLRKFSENLENILSGKDTPTTNPLSFFKNAPLKQNEIDTLKKIVQKKLYSHSDAHETIQAQLGKFEEMSLEELNAFDKELDKAKTALTLPKENDPDGILSDSIKTIKTIQTQVKNLIQEKPPLSPLEAIPITFPDPTELDLSGFDFTEDVQKAINLRHDKTLEENETLIKQGQLSANILGDKRFNSVKFQIGKKGIEGPGSANAVMTYAKGIKNYAEKLKKEGKMTQELASKFQIILKEYQTFYLSTLFAHVIRDKFIKRMEIGREQYFKRREFAREQIRKTQIRLARPKPSELLPKPSEFEKELKAAAQKMLEDDIQKVLTGEKERGAFQSGSCRHFVPMRYERVPDTKPPKIRISFFSLGAELGKEVKGKYRNEVRIGKKFSIGKEQKVLVDEEYFNALKSKDYFKTLIRIMSTRSLKRYTETIEQGKPEKYEDTNLEDIITQRPQFIGDCTCRGQWAMMKTGLERLDIKKHYHPIKHFIEGEAMNSYAETAEITNPKLSSKDPKSLFSHQEVYQVCWSKHMAMSNNAFKRAKKRLDNEKKPWLNASVQVFTPSPTHKPNYPKQVRFNLERLLANRSEINIGSSISDDSESGLSLSDVDGLEDSHLCLKVTGNIMTFANTGKAPLYLIPKNSNEKPITIKPENPYTLDLSTNYSFALSTSDNASKKQNRILTLSYPSHYPV